MTILHGMILTPNGFVSGSMALNAEGRIIGMEALERFAFYNLAKQAFAIIRTSDPGPYGCFIFTKGVV